MEIRVAEMTQVIRALYSLVVSRRMQFSLAKALSICIPCFHITVGNTSIAQVS